MHSMKPTVKVNSNEPIIEKDLTFFCLNCGRFHFIPNVKVDMEGLDNDFVKIYREWEYSCTCGSTAMEIDHDMIHAYTTLYNIGIPIIECCSGHYDTGYRQGHIVFDITQLSVNGELINTEFRKKYGCPDNWHYNVMGMTAGEVDDYYVDLRMDSEGMYSCDETEYQQLKEEYLNCLFKWLDEFEAKLNESNEG